MTDHPLVTVKRRTIVVWQTRFGRQRQSGQLAGKELEDYRQTVEINGAKVLYLVRCRPRVRRS